MSQFTQESHFLSISDFSLGKDTFLLTQFQGNDYISRMFCYEIEVISENQEVQAEDIVGKTCTVTFNNELITELADNSKTYFNGYVSHFNQGQITSDGNKSQLRKYQMTMVPWLWFLTLTNNHRIFQNKTCKEIVSEVFSGLNFNDFDFKAKGGDKRDYCIQHNESDFDFVSRLLEEEGIAYYFKQENNKHTLQLVDQKNAYEVCEKEKLSCLADKSNSYIYDLTSWENKHHFRKGQWTLNDYDFKKPNISLIASSNSTSKFAKNDKYEHYEYPGLYNFSKAKDIVESRLVSEEVQRNIIFSSSHLVSLTAGGKFSISDHHYEKDNESFIIIGIHHKAHDESYFNKRSDKKSQYSNSFSCIPDKIHFRPLQQHKRPIMAGPQTAVVVGPSGEEIYTDEWGRVKVQFIWDRNGKMDENSSCWLRVAQSWAGNGWGSSFIPRIGHEVIVSFLDGDPDRPMIIGSFYNDKNKIPYPSKTQSGIKTRSTKGASPNNFNELRFEDKKGQEQIYIRAEHNMDTHVENNESLSVANTRTKSIKKDENSTVDNDRTKSIGKNQTESIGENKNTNVGGNFEETIGKNVSISIGENETVNIGKNNDVSIGANSTNSIGKNMTVNIGEDLKQSVGGKCSETVAKEYGLTADSITLQANDQITFKTGSAKIIMKKNGDITISGKNINVKGSGNLVLKGSKVSTN